MDYAKLALLGLQVVLWFMERAKAAQDFQAGQDREIARSAHAVLMMTKEGKRIEEMIARLGREDVGKLLTELES